MYGLHLPGSGVDGGPAAGLFSPRTAGSLEGRKELLPMAQGAAPQTAAAERARPGSDPADGCLQGRSRIAEQSVQAARRAQWIVLGGLIG